MDLKLAIIKAQMGHHGKKDRVSRMIKVIGSVNS
jgi:hypothetical protein